MDVQKKAKLITLAFAVLVFLSCVLSAHAQSQPHKPGPAWNPLTNIYFEAEGGKVVYRRGFADGEDASAKGRTKTGGPLVGGKIGLDLPKGISIFFERTRESLEGKIDVTDPSLKLLADLEGQPQPTLTRRLDAKNNLFGGEWSPTKHWFIKPFVGGAGGWTSVTEHAFGPIPDVNPFTGEFTRSNVNESDKSSHGYGYGSAGVIFRGYRGISPKLVVVWPKPMKFLVNLKFSSGMFRRAPR